MTTKACNASALVVHELNRDLFIKWSIGTLLERDKTGKCLVLDGSDFSKQCEAAEAAMDAGDTIYLTDENGKLITKMFLTEAGYSEFEL
jgi:hypothetical protein